MAETPSDAPTAPATAAPSTPDVPGYLAINGRSLVLLGLALPAGAMVLFGLEAADAASYGALLGWAVGVLDLLITGYYLRRARHKPDDMTAAVRLVGVSMIARLIVAVLGFVMLRRFEIVAEAAFLIAFAFAHMVSISGWVWQQMIDLRELAKDEPSA